MKKTTTILSALVLVGCANDPVWLDQQCPCQSQIAAAVESVLDTATAQDDDFQCQIDDAAYDAAELRWEVHVLRERIEDLESAVAALEDDGAP